MCCALFLSRPGAWSEGYVIEWGERNAFTGEAVPTKLVASNAIVISAGRLQSLALKDDGTVVAWALNGRNEPTFENTLLTSGDSATILTNGIVRIDGKILKDVISIAAADGFTLALKRDGTVVASGGNYVPPGLANIAAITAELSYAWALRSNGTVIGWATRSSNPDYRQLISLENLSNVVAIAVGPGGYGRRGVALRRGGTVATWGSKTDNKEFTEPPAGLSNVIAVAAGASHSLALKSDGTVIGWGWNKVGEATGIPTTNSPDGLEFISSGQVHIDGQVLSNVVSIAAGPGYSMALKKDGTVVTWGRMVNDQYAATVPEGLSNVVAIAAGPDYCLAITTNSAVAERFRNSNFK